LVLDFIIYDGIHTSIHTYIDIIDQDDNLMEKLFDNSSERGTKSMADMMMLKMKTPKSHKANILRPSRRDNTHDRKMGEEEESKSYFIERKKIIGIAPNYG